MAINIFSLIFWTPSVTLIWLLYFVVVVVAVFFHLFSVLISVVFHSPFFLVALLLSHSSNVYIVFLDYWRWNCCRFQYWCICWFVRVSECIFCGDSQFHVCIWSSQLNGRTVIFILTSIVWLMFVGQYHYCYIINNKNKRERERESEIHEEKKQAIIEYSSTFNS